MIPESMFWSMASFVRLTSFPISGGIVPDRRFFERIRVWSRGSEPISSGISPEIELFERSICTREVRFATQLDSFPLSCTDLSFKDATRIGMAVLQVTPSHLQKFSESLLHDPSLLGHQQSSRRDQTWSKGGLAGHPLTYCWPALMIALLCWRRLIWRCCTEGSVHGDEMEISNQEPQEPCLYADSMLLICDFLPWNAFGVEKLVHFYFAQRENSEKSIEQNKWTSIARGTCEIRNLCTICPTIIYYYITFCSQYKFTISWFFKLVLHQIDATYQFKSLTIIDSPWLPQYLIIKYHLIIYSYRVISMLFQFYNWLERNALDSSAI